MIEKSERNFSAYVPNLSVCVSVGGTLDEGKAEIREPMVEHIIFQIEWGEKFRF